MLFTDLVVLALIRNAFFNLSTVSHPWQSTSCKHLYISRLINAWISIPIRMLKTDMFGKELKHFTNTSVTLPCHSQSLHVLKLIQKCLLKLVCCITITMKYVLHTPVISSPLNSWNIIPIGEPKH